MRPGNPDRTEMAPRVTAVMNQKGGAGKTTLSVNLAAGLARRARTVLLDLDPQESALEWARQGAEAWPRSLPVLSDAADRARLLKRHADCAHLVLDCPPSLDHPASALALRCCDIALVPVLPSPVDLWASLRLQRLIEAARRKRPALRAFLVINQVEPRSALSAALDRALGEFGLPVLNSRIRRRAAFRTAALEGVPVYQLGRRGAAAAADIEAIIEETYTP